MDQSNILAAVYGNGVISSKSEINSGSVNVNAGERSVSAGVGFGQSSVGLNLGVGTGNLGVFGSTVVSQGVGGDASVNLNKNNEAIATILSNSKELQERADARNVLKKISNGEQIIVANTNTGGIGSYGVNQSSLWGNLGFGKGGFGVGVGTSYGNFTANAQYENGSVTAGLGYRFENKLEATSQHNWAFKAIAGLPVVGVVTYTSHGKTYELSLDLSGIGTVFSLVKNLITFANDRRDGPIYEILDKDASPSPAPYVKLFKDDDATDLELSQQGQDSLRVFAKDLAKHIVANKQIPPINFGELVEDALLRFGEREDEQEKKAQILIKEQLIREVGNILTEEGFDASSIQEVTTNLAQQISFDPNVNPIKDREVIKNNQLNATFINLHEFDAGDNGRFFGYGNTDLKERLVESVKQFDAEFYSSLDEEEQYILQSLVLQRALNEIKNGTQGEDLNAKILDTISDLKAYHEKYGELAKLIQDVSPIPDKDALERFKEHPLVVDFVAQNNELSGADRDRLIGTAFVLWKNHLESNPQVDTKTAESLIQDALVKIKETPEVWSEVEISKTKELLEATIESLPSDQREYVDDVMDSINKIQQETDLVDIALIALMENKQLVNIALMENKQEVAQQYAKILVGASVLFEYLDLSDEDAKALAPYVRGGRDELITTVNQFLQKKYSEQDEKELARIEHINQFLKQLDSNTPLYSLGHQVVSEKQSIKEMIKQFDDKLEAAVLSKNANEVQKNEVKDHSVMSYIQSAFEKNQHNQNISEPTIEDPKQPHNPTPELAVAI